MRHFKRSGAQSQEVIAPQVSITKSVICASCALPSLVVCRSQKATFETAPNFGDPVRGPAKGGKWTSTKRQYVLLTCVIDQSYLTRNVKLGRA